MPAFLADPEYDETAKANILSRNALAFYRIDEKRGAKSANVTTVSEGRNG